MRLRSPDASTCTALTSTPSNEQNRDLVEIESGVEDREWGARELVLRDPDGYFLTFTQPA